MLNYFRYILFKSILYFKGIRFFKTEIIPTNAEFRKTEFKTIDNKEIQFLFYRETLVDIVFKRGKIKKEYFYCYVVQCKFNQFFSEDLNQFNNLKFLFKANALLLIDENKICKELLNVYLDFIKNELLTNKVI